MRFFLFLQKNQHTRGHGQLSAMSARKAMASWSRRLRTPPMPATHAAVGNPWQNRRLCQSKRPHSSYVSDLVSHQRMVRPGLLTHNTRSGRAAVDDAVPERLDQPAHAVSAV